MLLETIRELKSLNIDCYFEKEHMHSISSDGELFLTLLAMYAEEEARSASENQKWRIKEKYERGIPINGKVYGYKLIDGKYIIVPDEAEIVRRIYDMYLSGNGLIKIAKTLNDDEVPHPAGKQWAINGIRGILTNEKYVGNLLLQKTFVEDFRTKKLKNNNGERRKYFVENSHEGIVDQKTYDAVQEEILRRRKLYDRGQYESNKKRHLFSGIIRCGKCGRIYAHTLKDGRHIWSCPAFRYYGRKGCPSGQIPEDILIERTKEILDVDDLTPEILKEKLTEIVVPEHKVLVYHLYDGSEIPIVWEHKSRSLSWTEEMKEAARRRYKGKPRGGKEETK